MIFISAVFEVLCRIYVIGHVHLLWRLFAVAEPVTSKYAVHMSPSAGKFELFMRGLACSIVCVCLASDDRAAGTESFCSSLLHLYFGRSQCVGAIFAIKRIVFICVTFASYGSWKWCGRKFYEIYSSSIESCNKTCKVVKIIRITILVLGQGEGCKRNNFYWSRDFLRSLRT